MSFIILVRCKKNKKASIKIVLERVSFPCKRGLKLFRQEVIEQVGYVVILFIVRQLLMTNYYVLLNKEELSIQ